MKKNEVKTIKIGVRMTPEERTKLIQVSPGNYSHLVRKLIQDHLVKIQSEAVSR